MQVPARIMNNLSVEIKTICCLWIKCKLILLFKLSLRVLSCSHEMKLTSVYFFSFFFSNQRPNFPCHYPLIMDMVVAGTNNLLIILHRAGTSRKDKMTVSGSGYSLGFTFSHRFNYDFLLSLCLVSVVKPFHHFVILFIDYFPIAWGWGGRRSLACKWGTKKVVKNIIW